MEKAVVGNQAGKVLKKGKKKQAKDELDRQKQAEKKRRRLEKALANSAAIISELEKKKQKKEEQERLDEEGASIAEAVALHVLIGEDSDESRHLVLNKHRRCNDWDPSAGFDFTLSTQGAADIYSPGGLMCANQAYAASKGRWIDWGNAHPLPTWGEVRDLKASYYQGTFHQSTVACPGFMAAQAVSSLQIREDSSSPGQGVAASTVVNRMLGGTNRLNLYREI